MDVSFIIRLIDQFTAPAQKIADTARGMGNVLKGGAEGFSSAIKDGFSAENIEAATKNAQDKLNQARGRLLGAFAQAMTLAAPVRSAIEWENAMLGVSKQLDGARDASGNLTPAYYEMSDAIQELGRVTPVANTALAEMVTAGLRMGVAKDQVIQFVQETAKMATAFEMPEGPLADSMGKIAGLYKIPISAIGELGDTINYLDDNAISTGSGIIDFLTRTGGSAGAVKITAKDMAALGSTLLTLGEQTETAGTATNAIMTKLASATKGTKKFTAAMGDLGLSTKEIQDGMQKDAFGTILTVLDAVNKLPAADRMGILADLVGLEHADTLAKLVSQVDELRRQRELANGEAAKGSMDREYQARLKTTTAQWEMFRNRLSEVSVTIGSVLLPALNGTMAVIGPIVTSMAEWAQANPDLTKAIVATVAALMGLSIAGKVLGFVIAGMRVGLLPLLGLFLKFNREGRNIAVGWRALRAAGRGIAGVLRGIGAGARIAAAGFGGLSSGARRATGDLAGAQRRLGGLRNAVRRIIAGTWIWSIGFEILDDLGRTPEERMEQVRKNHERWRQIEKNVEESWFGQMWQGVKDRANAMMGLEQGAVPAEVLAAWGKAKAAEFYSVGVSWITSLWDGLKSLWGSIAQWFSEQIAGLKGLLNFDLNINWPQPPAWLTYLMGLAGSGIDRIKKAMGSGAEAVMPPGISSTDTPLSKVVNPLADTKVQQTIEVVNGQTPNVHINAPVHINGVSDPHAAGKAAAAEIGKLGASIANAKSGALHGGTE